MWVFDIRPFAGALPVAFGMSRADVHGLLGAPEVESRQTQWRRHVDSWDECRFNVGYDEQLTVVHVGFIPGRFFLRLAGTPLWSVWTHPDPNPFLLRLDPEPVEALGFLIFGRIGVTTTGYHQGDEGDLSIAVHPRETWDAFLKKGVAPDLSRYGRGP